MTSKDRGGASGLCGACASIKGHALRMRQHKRPRTAHASHTPRELFGACRAWAREAHAQYLWLKCGDMLATQWRRSGRK
jgi:hypothetical protein